MSERVNDPRLQLLERTPEGDLQLQQGAELLDAEGSSMVRVKTKFVTAADFQTEPAAATFGTQVVDVGGTRVGGSATGLTNTVAATSGKQTVQASALSLNHFDGSDEDQSTADGIAGNVVALNTCRLDTAQKKFGTTSLRVPINGLTTILLGSGLHGGATAEVMLDFWIRHGDVDDRIDFKFRDSAQPGLTFPAISFGLKSHGASAKLYYGVSTDGSAQEDAVTGATTGVGMNKNVWHFVRLVHRANAKTEIWLNESLIHVVTPAAIPYPWDQVIIDGDNLVFAQAWVDDMRVHPRHGFYEVGVVTASPTAAFDPENTELWNGVDAAGYQVVDVGGTRVGGDPTGLVNDTTIYE
ncbi:MAG: hypothetical protein ACREVF_06605, partial [Burkholderiales bacterium]